MWGEAKVVAEQHGSLLDDYVVPPFSVLDTRQGYWQERRRRWLSLGITSELGRGGGAMDVSEAVAVAKGFDKHPSAQAGYSPGAARAFTQDLMKGELRSSEGRTLQPGGNHRSDYTVHEPGKGNIYQGNRESRAAAAPEPGMFDAPPDLRRKTAEGRSNIQGQGEHWLAEANGLAHMSPGTSIFDPVLCEVSYRWWCPPGGTILDPFAGGSVRGIVAAKLGHPYVGVDLSPVQVAANRQQAAQLLEPTDPMPTWIVGDSLHLATHVGPLVPDMVFTCPPYYDLEVYSDDPSDLSAQPNYASFLEAYRAILATAVGLLAPGRFAVVVVSEIRDKRGLMRGFVPDTIAALRDAGAEFYNEAVLVNSAGSLPLRAGAYMRASRKLGRSHQNVICAVKGGWDEVRGWESKRAEPPDPQVSIWSDL